MCFDDGLLESGCVVAAAKALGVLLVIDDTIHRAAIPWRIARNFLGIHIRARGTTSVSGGIGTVVLNASLVRAAIQ
jgi:hypothetical protein